MINLGGRGLLLILGGVGREMRGRLLILGGSVAQLLCLEGQWTIT